jgi:ATP-dependent RNA helicase DHX37/DHR1
VVDSGKAKEKVFDDRLQMSAFKVQWISQASAEQRAGRAGRTAPGHCYRLYSAALYSKLPDHSEPEILKTPLPQTLLQLKSIGVEDLIRFPYVTIPPSESLLSAIKQLTLIGALTINHSLLNKSVSSFSRQDNKSKEAQSVLENSLLKSFDEASGVGGRDPTEISELGTLLSKVPIQPRLAKILIVASKYDLLHYAIMMVACMSVQEIYDNSALISSLGLNN